MVEVGLPSWPVGAEGVAGDWDCAAGVAGLEEVDRGGTLLAEVGMVRSPLRD